MGWKLIFSRGMEVIFVRYGTLVTEFMLGTNLQGSYGRALKYWEMAPQTVAPAVVTVALPTYSKVQDDRQRLSQAFSIVLFFLTRALMPFVLVFAILPESFIRILGEQWLDAVPVLRILAVGALLSPMFENMKQLLAAGYSHIFQICKCFRSKERGRQHLPELTMLEWYRSGGNYHDLMDDCQDLIGFIAGKITGSNLLNYQGQAIPLTAPWSKLTVHEAFHQYASIAVEEALAKDCFEEVMVNDIEPHLGITEPTFVYDYPAELGALARLNPENNRVAERFELYVAGIELCNGFSELTDPVEQCRRFESEQKIRQSLNKPLYPMPQKFLDSLSDMPAACGNALGIDRLVMLFADTTNIDDVVAFTPEEL